MNINNSLVESLARMRLNLTHYYLLLLAEKGEYTTLDEACEQTLVRKGYMADKRLSDLGQELLNNLKQSLKGSKTLVKEKIASRKTSMAEGIEKWWQAYPATNTWFDDTDKKWEGGRNLRIKKDKCFEKIQEDWLSKGASIETMIELVAWDVKKLQNKSLVTGNNEMDYMPSSERWLNTRNYADAVESMRIEKRAGNSPKNQPVDTTSLF